MKPLIITAVLIAMMMGKSFAERQIDLRTLEIAKHGESPERYVKVHGSYVLLTFADSQPSEAMKANANPASLPLYEKIANTDGGFVYKVSIEVTLPAEATNILLVGFKTADGPQYLAIDDDLLASKNKECFLVNLSTVEVELQLGSEREVLKIAANSSATHQMAVSEDAGIAVTGKAQIGDKVRTFHSTYWSPKDSEHGLVVFICPQGERLVLKKFKGISIKPKET